MTNFTSMKQQSATFPDLCHKCGRCCTVATTFNTHSTLLKQVASGEQEAIEFLNIFEPYLSHDEARKVVPEQVEQVLKEWKHRGRETLEDITFYHCRYVTEEGLCGIYEKRPRVCREAPYHGWSAMPPGCGFEGWQFVQREAQRASIRKLKEIQFQMTQLSPDGVHLPARDMTLTELDAVVEEKLEPWTKYGSVHW